MNQFKVTGMTLFRIIGFQCLLSQAFRVPEQDVKCFMIYYGNIGDIQLLFHLQCPDVWELYMHKICCANNSTIYHMC
jgi:hypothetical protein